MRAVTFPQPGPPGVLEISDVPAPEPGPTDVVIAVEAAGVSRADLLQRKGAYPPPPGASEILGLDVAGVIAKTGAAVKDWKPGDRVCALVSGGGYAEQCLAPCEQVLPIPDGWSAPEAVTLPENLFTVYDNLVTRARLSKGETVLVHGGASGIGSMAVMLALCLGASPYATAGSDAKCDALRQLGVRDAVNYNSADFVEAVLTWTANKGVDVILDMVGGNYLARNVDALAVEGRLILLATLGGNEGMLPIARLMRKRGTIVASTLRNRTRAEKGAIAKRLREHIWPLLPSRSCIRPVIDSTWPLPQAASAHRRLEEGHHVGKIVLTVER